MRSTNRPEGGSTVPIDYGDIEWPPAPCREPSRLYREYEAWYTGDTETLSSVYGGAAGLTGTLVNRASQYRGGLVGAVARFWWGRPLSTQQGTTRFHVPAAADVAAYSSRLLYRDPLTVRALDGTDAASARLADIVDRGALHAALLEAGELCSAYGGAYLVAFVDQGVADHPLTAVYAPDCAVPEWRNGYLTAVTFWRVLPDAGDRYTWRHLERHELGVVWHALYRGTGNRLGDRWAFEARPEMTDLARRVDEFGGIETGIEQLDVSYLPNLRPQRARQLKGSPLGRSDYHDATQAFDGLDETWSSWMRDLRLAKARLVVPAAYLQSYGPGAGANFDAEREVFTSVNTLGGPDRGMELSQVQFAIRVTEHEATCAGHWRTILRHVGLSGDAFGDEVDGGAATAKEIGRRGELTRDTRSCKILYARPGIARHATALLALDVAHYGPAGVAPAPAAVDWPAEQPDLETMSRTLQLLDAAASVSTQTKVAMLHPRWGEAEIAGEVARIDADRAAPAPLVDPSAFTGE